MHFKSITNKPKEGVNLNKHDLELIKTVANLLGRVPSVKTGFNSPTATAGVFIKAYDDFNTASKYASSVLRNRVEVEEWKAVLKNPEANEFEIKEVIKQYKDQLKESLKQLENFISDREKEGWK